jgi:ectoine hydroxylase-related dioxygenase (phytanoyl-CoA dioxygenase family)
MAARSERPASTMWARDVDRREALLTTELDTPYELAEDAVERFRRAGFVHLHDVVSAATLARYGEEITAKVVDLNTMQLPLEERSTYDKAFLQVTNIWRESEVARKLVFSRRLAQIATELLGTKGVRLYHDQALYKESGGGLTPWHVDEYYWPLSGELTVTAWIPFQDTPVEMGPLSFASGSQRFTALRDLSIGDDSERLIQEAMQRERFPYVQEPFALGDVSFHYGSTFHRAPANLSDRPRRVMTVIYMDRDIKVAEPVNESQRGDLEGWLAGARIGESPDGPLNPVLYEHP